ncbi:MAG: carboxylating nicotinate-nucleotide diphosphorylase [Nitrospinota bacterium]|nr:carboxylating nicotinate-nucleotide diphosphorylase [Nitrospinota bacterium]
MGQIDSLTVEQMDGLVKRALEEDLGSGDITTDGILSQDDSATAVVTAKESMVVCGLEIFRRVFLCLDPKATFPGILLEDGAQVSAQSEIIRVSAKTSALLKGERTALNILQRLSGIATLTRKYVDAARPVTILDTRKTTPGLRIFEKYAVHCGGGTNHRFGLFDAILIKDNHIKIAGGITSAIQRIRSHYSGKVEVETTNLEEVHEALKMSADIIMLDNMAPQIIKKAVSLIDGKSKIEVSGCVTLDDLNILKELGIDYISVGALTHSARSMDISMNF